ncbi:Uncharacterised protein [Zhongshania aliphaticivorans]|uniref:HTH tetR-type domain-containing protein n=1 Tax=Zhongshania aliphaticivorans TaxID=1470434 RepID=A0A5S9N817_9GAMM|nr:TetR/AcrR family transcriptional regulator [Zhongshania aliphaticivorans]CAA0079467.1 Uncharacterised protein [Zhongshania aliphaticivorans]CAA0086133.1 Uncharacterised protein [Zhongshania aliphaticivorans]
MTAGVREQDSSVEWPEDLSFAAYQRVLPLNKKNVYEYFFEANKASISVQNARLAIPKLEMILKAIFSISAKRGFHAMSLRDLCKETALSMGGMYNYISSKEELARMVTEFVGMTFLEINNRLPIPDDDINGQLEAQLCARIYMSELFRSWYFFVYMETKNQPVELIQRSLEVERNATGIIETQIEKGIKSGIYKPVDSALAAAALVSMVEEWFLKPWYFQERGTDVQAYADFVVGSARSLLGVSKSGLKNKAEI